MSLFAIGLGYQELIIILIIVFLLFGATRLPQLAKALGQSKRAFREGQDEAEEDARRDAAKRRAEVSGKRAELASADDEELFEEARRRRVSADIEEPKTR